MKRFFTLLAILIIWALNASADLTPARITVTTSTPSPSTARQLTLDVLNSSGESLGLSFSKGIVKTDEGGVLSFVMNSSDLAIASPNTPWTNLTYHPNDLIRITYNNVVLSIERMETVYAKQGLFGANIDAGEIEPSANGNVLSTNSSGVTSWQPATEVLKTATMNWFFMPSVALDVADPINGELRTVDLYAKFTAQFTNPMYKNASAPSGYGVLPTLPPASAFNYYITYYDNTVFSIQSLSDTGVLTYYVIGTATEATYVNIIFVIQ